MNMQKILTGAIAVVITFFIYDFFFKTPSFDNGVSAPAIDAQLIDGTDFTLEDLQGKYVLIDFWGSWCGPCIREIPELKKLYSDYNGKSYKDAIDFEVLSIALEKSDRYTRRIIKDRALNWPYHIIDVSRIVMLSGIAQDYNVKELPTKFLLNPKGQIIGTNLSYRETAKMLDARLQQN